MNGSTSPGVPSENQKQEGISFSLTPDHSQVQILIDPSRLLSPLSRNQLLTIFQVSGFDGYQLQEDVLHELLSSPLGTSPYLG